MRKAEITVIGAAILDLLARPVTPAVFETGSQPVREMRLSGGGDALNEAVALARLGKHTELVSTLGRDRAGETVLQILRDAGVATNRIVRQSGLRTGVNAVLVDESGERHFLTDPESSLRRLSETDILPALDAAADIVSFAGIFVSPLLDIPALERIFQRIKEKPERILVADMTKAKHAERLSDLMGLLPYVDCILPNEEEIALLTGERDPRRNAAMLIEAGASCAVIKLGKRGCLVRTADAAYQIPACPVERAVDTTGAGDCFAAGFLWGLSEGLPLLECGRFGCAAASCCVEQLGATDGISSLEEPLKRYRACYK